MPEIKFLVSDHTVRQNERLLVRERNLSDAHELGMEEHTKLVNQVEEASASLFQGSKRMA